MFTTSNPAGEFASRWNQIIPSLLNTYEKLKKFGFTYSDGKVSPSILVDKEGERLDSVTDIIPA